MFRGLWRKAQMLQVARDEIGLEPATIRDAKLIGLAARQGFKGGGNAYDAAILLALLCGGEAAGSQDAARLADARGYVPKALRLSYVAAAPDGWSAYAADVCARLALPSPSLGPDA